jgi:hypothetical protein
VSSEEALLREFYAAFNARDTAGAVLSDRQVDHLYAFEDGLIRAMDIEP